MPPVKVTRKKKRRILIGLVAIHIKTGCILGVQGKTKKNTEIEKLLKEKKIDDYFKSSNVVLNR